jgi:tape measure domain-containing protein
MGRSADATTDQIKSAIKGLQNLSKEAVADSNAFVQLTKDIKQLGEVLDSAEEKSARNKQVSSLLNGVIRKSASLISLQSRAYKEAVKATEEEIRAIDRLTKKQREAGKTAERRAELEGKLQRQLLKATETGYLEFVASGRRETIKLAEAFNSADQGIGSFNARLRKLDEDFGKLPNTTAGINQKIAELNIQLSNTNRTSSDYTRISNEILSLQKELTKETGAYADAFAELNRQQESAARRRGKLAGIEEYIASVSGLGSAAAAERAARGGTPVVGQMRREGFPQGYRDPETGAMIAPGYGARGDRRAYQEAEELKRIAEAQKQLEATFDSAADSYRDALQVIQQYQEQRHNEFMSQIAKEDEAQQKAFTEQVAREEEAFKQELRRRDILLQAQKAAASALGLGGREDISSLYQGIIGLSTADIRRQQQMMGKSATEVFNDIATAFSKGGQAVDLKAKSTDIGGSIAEGIVDGASDSNEINSGAKTFAQRLIAAYKSVFGIRSPSKETEQKIGIPLGLGIIRGLIKGLREGKREVQQEIESIADPVIGRSRQPRRLIGTVNQPIATFTGYGTVARPAQPGYRPLGQAAAEINRETDQMFDRFRAGIAALTTDAEIYYNLLKKLPASRITTDLADLASKRARAAEVGGFIENQRLIGPGELEREIASSVAGYLKDLRTPNPWVGITGDYKQFINSISAETKRLRSSIPALPPGKVAGLLPPAPTGLTPAQQRRVAQAYARSDERSARISAEDASRGRALPPGQAGGELALISQFIGGGSGGGRSVGGAGGADGSFARFNKILSDFGRLSDRSTADIRELGASLSSLGDILSPLDADFEKVNKAIDKQSRLIDKELEKRDRRRRRGRGMSAGQLAQAAGATISGGIFGGPEGFLGGAIGTALGGPGGAFAGAAIGAQVGGLRRELGGYAEYAAQIEKLKIALKGLTKDQSEFNYALAASQKVTQDFNIPQQESIRGITRLAAAIKGAGGPLTDAEVVFRNVTTAIKATGGSAQDVEGAVTAMVQVFSKGKVSAEELSGQLGERLPGAVTMFAKANNMSLTELQDNLKAGTVGLNELMKFVRSLGDTYGATARKISDSNADAGARLQVVVNNMKTAIGDALIPIGAQLQDAFGKFLQEITPTLVEVLPKIGELLLGIVKNLDLVAQAAAAVFAVVVVGKITAIIASIGSLGAAIFTLKLNAIVATKALIGLNAAALLNPYVALAAGAAALGVAIFRAAQEQKRLNTLIKEGSVADIDKKLAENRTKIIEIEQRQLEGADPRSAYQAERRAGLAVLPSQASLDQAALKQAQSLEKKLKDARKRAVYDATQGADLPENLLRPFDYQSPKGDGGDGKGGSSAKEKRERKSQLESINARLTLLDIDKMIRANAREIVEAQADNNFERVKELSLQKLSLASQKEFASVQLDYRDALARAAGDENEQMLKAEAAASRDRAIQELRFKLKEDMLDLEQQSRLEQEARTRAAEDEVFALREQLGLVSPQERISRYRTGLEEQGTPNADELTDLYRQTIDPTFAEGISQNIRALKQDLEDLVNPINQITGAANAIGTAFTDSFMSVITNSATAQEALASFFSNVGKYFLDMAAQIIQKMIVLALLNQVAKLLPSGGSGPSGFNLTGFGNLQSDAGSGISGFMAGAGGILGRASGGLVMPGNTYMVGERGPELLQLNRNGSGQVINNNQLSSAMNRYRRPGGAAMTSAEGGMAASALSGSGVATLSKPIDVRYTVERINNVEYVTADQFQAGMRQAAQQGAMQGERRALTTLRQNTTQRKRIGL